MPFPLERFQRSTIGCTPRALIDHGLVPVHAEGFECAQDVVRGTGNDARRVEIVDAHEPVATCRARGQIAACGGNQRSGMQRTARCRSEAPAITQDRGVQVLFGRGTHAAMIPAPRV